MTRIQTAEDVTKKLYQFSDERQKSPGVVYGVPWPWKKMNSLTGGMKLEELIVLMARPGKGKTAFMCQVAYSVARWVQANKPDEVVRLVLCEQSAEAIQMRMASAALGISQTRIKQGKLSPKQLKDYHEALDKIAKLPIEYLDPLSLDHTRRFIAEGRESSSGQKGKPTAWWAVDYIQIHPYQQDKDTSLYVSTTKLSNGFRDLALHIAPGLVLSQMSRAIDNPNRKDKTPMLSDLRESGAIEQDASLVIAPIRDDDNQAVPEEFSGDPIGGRFKLLKHRNGPLGSVPFEWFPRTMSFEDRSDEWVEEDAA